MNSLFFDLTRTISYLSVLLDCSCMSGFVSIIDESSEEEEVKVVMKEEHEMDVAHSWMEVGGFLALADKTKPRHSTGVVVAGISLYLVWLSLSNHSFTVLWLSMAFVTDPFFLFPGVGFVEMGQLAMGGSTTIGDRGAAED